MDDYTTSEVQKTISALSSLISSNNGIAVKNISLALSSLSKSSLKSTQDATLAVPKYIRKEYFLYERFQ